jgi:hypothetical protein
MEKSNCLDLNRNFHIYEDILRIGNQISKKINSNFEIRFSRLKLFWLSNI